MVLDVLVHTRATLMNATNSPVPKGMDKLVKVHRGDRLLELLIFNQEFLVSPSHQVELITSLPFVHTARSYPLNVSFANKH
jgi:hypothetical protein